VIEFLLVITPGSGLMVMIFKFVRARSKIGVARIEVVRAEARLDAARQTSELMGETAKEAMGQVTDALAIARTIETVDANVSYIISRIDGSSADRPTTGRHALPSADQPPAIGNGIIS
jgi:hypothetical protein